MKQLVADASRSNKIYADRNLLGEVRVMGSWVNCGIWYDPNHKFIMRRTVRNTRPDVISVIIN
jgi:hypothetical protein